MDQSSWNYNNIKDFKEDKLLPFFSASDRLRDLSSASPLITVWLLRCPSSQSLKWRPSHIPKSWLWKIHSNHSFNLVPLETLQFFSPLFQTWQQACMLSPLAVCWALELSGILRLPQLWAHFLFTYSTPTTLQPSILSNGASGCEGQVRRWAENLRWCVRGTMSRRQTRAGFGEGNWKCERLTLLLQHVNGLQSGIIELPPAITVVMENSVGI